MNGLYKKIELLANVLIIIVALLLGFVLVKYYFLGSSQAIQGAVRDQLRPGTQFSLSGVDWAKNGQTLVLVLSKGCHYCTESAHFYQQIAQERARNENIRLVAVLPQEIIEGQQYMNNLGVTVDEVKQAPLDTIGVRGTPTLILISNTGIVTDS